MIVCLTCVRVVVQTGTNVGELQRVVVEHDGVSERDSWLLKVIKPKHSFKLRFHRLLCCFYLSFVAYETFGSKRVAENVCIGFINCFPLRIHKKLRIFAKPAPFVAAFPQTTVFSS